MSIPVLVMSILAVVGMSSLFIWENVMEIRDDKKYYERTEGK